MVSKSNDDITSVCFPTGTLVSVKYPLKSVLVPIVVPLIYTLQKAADSPVDFTYTTPFIVPYLFWEKICREIKVLKMMKKVKFEKLRIVIIKIFEGAK
jgi:hypothetical protein